MLFLSLDVFDQVIDVAPGARKGGVSPPASAKNLLNTELCLIQSAERV
jgi:hypothetical protein